MLGASAIEGLHELGLTKNTLEKCPWTISTSMGGDRARYSHHEGRVGFKTQ
jgi:hypothetical protein